MKHLNNLKSDSAFCKKYFPILSPEFPSFLHDYINAPELQRLKSNSMSCGLNYTDLFDLKFKYSNLNHSIGVALIVWNFTHDKKATLAGLFHDIANPAFKHCIDFMNGDSEKQESIDEKTEQILTNSQVITTLLLRDGIKISEVLNYKDYPIADNDTPKLSADRLEYTLANGFFWLSVWNIADIKEVYNDLVVLKNEDDIDELGFSTLKIAEKFVCGASKLWPTWISSRNKLAMQFIADTVARLCELDEIGVGDLWKLSEEEVVERIKKSSDKKLAELFEKFQNATECFESELPQQNVYCKSIKAKQRYIVPLVKTGDHAKRINELSQVADKQIADYLSHKFSKYAHFDFNLEVSD